MSELPPIPEEDDAALAEYVLGLLPFGEARILEQRLPQEPALAARHAEWAETLTAMLAGRDVPPPARLRAALVERLFPAAPARKRWLGWLGLIGGPVAAFAAAFVLLNPASGFDPVLHVDLIAPEIGLNIAAGADADTLRIIHQGGQPAPGRDFELWLIAGDAAPVSLGVVPTGGSVDLPRPDGLATGVVFAISDEPEGGSPTGAPTGAVLVAEPLFDI